MSWKSALREMSETHDFDPTDFKAGVFAVGSKYKSVLSARNEQIGLQVDKGWTCMLEETW